MKSSEIYERNAAEGKIEQIEKGLDDFIMDLKESLEIINENLRKKILPSQLLSLW